MGTPSNKVLTNVDQTSIFSENEKAQARANIDAAKNAVATQSTSGLMSSTDKTKLDGIESGAEVNVQANWTQTSTTADDYIKNKPDNLVQDANYVHTDNNFTTTEKDKLAGIAAGAEVNVQANWTQTNDEADDYIKNKPANLVQDASYVHTDNNFTTSLKDKLDGIAAGAEVNVQADWTQTNESADDYIKNKPGDLVQDVNYVHTDNNFTTALKDKLDGIAAGAEVNVQADWTQTSTTADDYIKNKPEDYDLVAGTGATITKDDSNHTVTVGFTQVNSDWNAVSGVAQILNKPTLATVATSGSYNDLTNKPSIPAAQVNSDWNASSGVAQILNKPANLVQDASYTHTDNNFTTTLKDKLDGIAAGAEVNVQANWTETNSSSDAFILNKPTLATVATSGSYNDLTNKPTIPAGQVQTNWTATSGMGQILNKPTLGYKNYGDSSVTEASSIVVDSDDPDGYAAVMVNNSGKGYLVQGPYKALLDSGVQGSVGNQYNGMYIDANGTFQTGSSLELVLASSSSYGVTEIHPGKMSIWPGSGKVTTTEGGVTTDRFYVIPAFNPATSANSVLTTDGDGNIGWKHFGVFYDMMHTTSIAWNEDHEESWSIMDGLVTLYLQFSDRPDHTTSTSLSPMGLAISSTRSRVYVMSKQYDNTSQGDVVTGYGMIDTGNKTKLETYLEPIWPWFPSTNSSTTIELDIYVTNSAYEHPPYAYGYYSGSYCHGHVTIHRFAEVYGSTLDPTNRPPQIICTCQYEKTYNTNTSNS
jgi:uncharacterized protein (DUF736 family)